MREALQMRARLVPYSYTAALTQWLDDVPFIRHVYVDFSHDKSAMNAADLGHFMYGASVLVAPITFPRANETNLTQHQVSLPDLHLGPQGEKVAWVERVSGRCLLGGNVIPLAFNFTLDETAEYVKGGTILPMAPTPSRHMRARDPKFQQDLPAMRDCHNFEFGDEDFVLGAAAHAPCTLVWHVYIGNSTEGSGTLLEDDGRSTAYQRGEFTRIDTNYSLQGDTLTVFVAPAVGSYMSNGYDYPMLRPMEWQIHNVLASMSAVVLQGGSGRGSDSDSDTTVHTSWDAQTLTTTVRLSTPVHPEAGVSVQIKFYAPPASALLCGNTALSARGGGFANTHQRALALKTAVDWEASIGTKPSMAFNRVVGTAVRMQTNPERAAVELANYASMLDAVVTLHTTGTHTGLPSPQLQTLITYWLG